MKMTSLQKLKMLQLQFPRFQDFQPDADEFDGDEFVKVYLWAGLSSGERAAHDFLLHIYNRHEYHFDLSRVASWDRGHLAVFVEWAKAPFWA